MDVYKQTAIYTRIHMHKWILFFWNWRDNIRTESWTTPHTYRHGLTQASLNFDMSVFLNVVIYSSSSCFFSFLTSHFQRRNYLQPTALCSHTEMPQRNVSGAALRLEFIHRDIASDLPDLWNLESNPFSAILFEVYCLTSTDSTEIQIHSRWRYIWSARIVKSGIWPVFCPFVWGLLFTKPLFYFPGIAKPKRVQKWFWDWNWPLATHRLTDKLKQQISTRVQKHLCRQVGGLSKYRCSRNKARGRAV